MEHLRKTSGDLVTDIHEQRRTKAKTLKEQMETAGGSTMWLQRSCPLLARGFPQDLSESELLAETIDCYEDSERRLKLCETCPGTGGACANDHTSVPIGLRPDWADRRVKHTPCDKWAEFLVRRRLGKSGVPTFYFDSTFQEFAKAKELPQATSKKVFGFGNAICELKRQWLVIGGASGSGKTRVAVSILRNVIKRAPRVLLWYSDVTTIRNVMRQRYDDPKSVDDPFENARSANLLVIDNVDPSRHVKEPWVHERMEALLRERWLDARSTLVLTHESVADLAKAYTSIPSFAEAPFCKLP